MCNRWISRRVECAARHVSTALLLGLCASSAVGAQTTRVSLSSAGAQALDSDAFGNAISWDGRFVVFESRSAQFVTGDTNGNSDVFVHDRSTSATSRVSVATGGVQGMGDSQLGAISADGRFVAFVSVAGNLVAGDTNGAADVFVHDRWTGTTTRASVGIGGTQANGASTEPAISADGRYVAFASRASNLVADDTNGAQDVYLHDRFTGSTTRLSLSASGAQGTANSWGPSLSADASVVAFVSRAPNLVAGDANGVVDVFVRDRVAGTTACISVAADGTDADSASVHPSISADGRYVAFASNASDLVAGDTNGAFDAFVRDRVAGTTRRASVSSARQQAGSAVEAEVTISADGRYVAFSSGAANLTPGDTNNEYDVYVHDTISSTTRRVSVTAGGDPMTGGLALVPLLSGDGRFVAFTAFGTNLVDADTNALGDVFVRDTRMFTWASPERVGIRPPEVTAAAPRVSADGRYIVYESDDPTLAPGDTNGAPDIFVFDRIAGAVSRVSVSSDATPANGGNYESDISADGRYVVFSSTATSLVANDTNGYLDVFLHDRALNVTTRVSVTNSGAQAAGGDSGQPRISADGRFVAFASEATNLFAGDTNGYADVFVRDLVLGTTTRVSAPRDGAPANGMSTLPAVSADGRMIAFSSTASNLVEGDTNGHYDVFVVDRTTHAIERVSVTSRGRQSNGESYRPAISADGRYVAFESTSSDLVDGDTNDTYDIFVRDRASSQTTRVSVTSAGRQAAGTSIDASISPDGRWVSFRSYAPDLVTGDTNDRPDVFLRDRTTAQTTRVARDNADSFTEHALSADARVVAVTGDQRDPWMRIASPIVTAVSPSAGTVAGGTLLRIDGEGFSAGTHVTIGSVVATKVDATDPRQLAVTTPPQVAGRVDIVVSVPGHEPERLIAAFTYTAGGAADTDADGLPDDFEARYSLDPLDQRDAAADPDGDGRTNAQELRDGTHPNGLLVRYLAEGATSAFFSTTLAIANPGDADATVLLRFLPATGAPIPHLARVPAHGRATVDVGSIAGLAHAEFATVLESDRVVVLDRLMSWDARGYGSTAETALPGLSREWFLAEGATHSGFDLFYLLQNPASTPTTVRVTFLRPAPLSPIVKDVLLPPLSRFNIWVNTIDPALASTDVSATLVASQPIAVERALYLSRPGQLFTAGHESAGVTAPALTWFLAEGATGPFFDDFVLLANPSAIDANARVTFLRPDGSTVVQVHTVPGQSRKTIWVDYADPALADTAVSTTVEVTNNVPLVVERAMWWPGDASRWYEAHNSPGATTAGTAWLVAGGVDGGTTDSETYVLVANTADIPATVRVTVLFEDGTTSTGSYLVSPHSRFNVQMRSAFASVEGRRFGVLVESVGLGTAPIVVESAIYGDANGQAWQTGANALATKLR